LLLSSAAISGNQKRAPTPTSSNRRYPTPTEANENNLGSFRQRANKNRLGHLTRTAIMDDLQQKQTMGNTQRGRTVTLNGNAP
jgi:hypothetical protein